MDGGPDCGHYQWMQRLDARPVFERIFEWLVVLPAMAGLAWFAWEAASELPSDELLAILVWVLITALVELIPVPVWRGTHIGMGFPLLMVVAFLYPPAAAGAAAFLAASDPRELRREIGPLRALFNRSQIGLAVWGASAVFHTLITDIEDASTPLLLAAALLAAVTDYVINFGITSIVASLHYRMSPLRVIRRLVIGSATEFVVSYLGLAVFGLVLAKIFLEVDFLAVPVILIPLLLARQMFFRSKALEEAHAELQDREQVLRTLSNRMAEERQDERQQIAAFLHDDLAQLLFRLSIQVDVARRHLSSGKLAETEQTLAEIKETKNRTSDRIRWLMRELHRSPLGAGLPEAIRGFIIEVGRDSDVDFHIDVDEIELPAPIALLLYQIAREGVMNSLKHANAKNLWVTVKPDGDEVTLVLRDDGVGYDTTAPEPEGHYGLTIMRERATVGGGSYTVTSAPGEGTTLTVRFPTSWLQEDPERDVRETPTSPPNGASPGIPARPSSTVGSVPASR
jgi:signal transduction histidine kinase